MKKKILFYLILILIPVFLFLLIEIFLRIIKFGDDLSLFIDSKTYPGYYEVNRKVTKRFFTGNQFTSPANDIFLKNKPAGTYRIFVLGSSTTLGFPYAMNVSFSRILYYRLRDIFPDKNIEVVNMAMTAINSYALNSYIDEILKQKPDAILIYAGHNEYYGAMGAASVDNGGKATWLKRMHFTLMHIRSYQLMQKIVYQIISKRSKNLASETLMTRIAKGKAVPYQSEIYFQGIKQFENNMHSVLKKIARQHVPVIISELVSNLRMKPFEAIANPDNSEAMKIFNVALQLEQDNKLDSARKLYYTAKDLDAIRFRAPENINLIIHKLAAEFQIPVVPMKKVFEQHSTNGIIGYELITEHLHPNANGYFLMAHAFLQIMLENNFISPSSDTGKLKPYYHYQKNWGYTELDSLKADITIKHLTAGWPFQPDTVKNEFLFTYKPQTLIDSLALICVKYDNVDLTFAHQELARYYEKNGQFEKAFNEYLALVYTYPYNLNYYITGVQFANLSHNDSLSRVILESMPKVMLDSSFFALTKLGKIALKEKRYNDAIAFFERARKAVKSDDNIIIALEGLYETYLEMGNKNKAKRMLFEIKDIDPNYTPKSITQKEDYMIVVDAKVKNLIEQAIQLARKQQFQEALSLLEKSLQIQQTAFAYQMIGSIMFQLKDNRAMEYLEKAYQLNPNDEPTVNNLVILSAMNKNQAKALKYMEKYKQIGEKEQIQKLQKLVNETFANKK